MRNIENLQWKKILGMKRMEIVLQKLFFVNWTMDYQGATSNRGFFNTLTTYEGQMKGRKIFIGATFKTCFYDHAWHD